MSLFITRSDVERTGLRGTLVEHDDWGVRARQLDSFWLYLDEEDDGYTPHALKDGFWEAWITLWMDQNVPDKSTVIDIGANHGYYSFFLASKGCTVFAVEPQPKLAELIRKSREVNHSGNVEVFQEAISNKRGKMRMMVPTHHGMNATISNAHSYAPDGYTTIEVDTSKLDDWTLEPDFIKVDAEGAEDLIWAGSKEFRQRNPQTAWLMEWRYDRYNNPEAFGEEIFSEYDVSAVTFEGNEFPLRHHTALYPIKHEDWMLVLRSKNQSGTMDRRG